MAAAEPAPGSAPDDELAGSDASVRLVAACIEAIERGEPDPVTRVCAGHPDLVAAVRRRLLQLGERGLLELGKSTPAVPPAIGAYRIVREIGRGGMGSVYLAEQDQPVRRQVALKVIKPGMDTREVVARFEAERQALALMNHPHIAKVHDAGATADGRPYFVMELVQGEPITDWCGRHRLDVPARAALVARVCRAVQHAHDRGVIHRDLKPSNILVVEHDGEPMPKVIDFGVAKATGPSLTADGATLHTRVGQMLGTPEYMSPEQASSGGLDVDTRTDVYSLGVVLYELLCGMLPFDSHRLRQASAIELERILQHEAPPAPSARCVERDLGRRLRGELDWICLRAIEKERDRRYPSALALAEDVERHLRHETVLAGPPTAAYRLRKLIRRHRVEAAALAAVLLALFGGLVASLAFWLDARVAQARERVAHGDTRDFYGFAREAIERMLVRVGQGRLKDVPQADGLRREILEDALAFYGRLLDRKPTDPLLRLETARSHLYVGSIRLELGQPEPAIEALATAIDRLGELLDDPGVGRRARFLRAEATRAHGTASLRMGNDAAARASWLRALDDLEVLRSAPAGPVEGQAACEAMVRHDLAVHDGGEPTAVADKLRRVIDLFDAAIRQTPERADLLLQRAHTRRYLALQLEAAGQASQGEAMLRATAAELDALAKQVPGLDVRDSLAKTHEPLAKLLLRRGELQEAESLLREALRLRQELVAAHPELPAHRARLAGGLAELARLLDRRGLSAEALAVARQEVAQCEQLVEAAPAVAAHPVQLLRARLGLATRLARDGSGPGVPEAEKVLRALIAAADSLLVSRPDDVEILQVTGTGLTALATLLGENERETEALALFERSRDLLARALARSNSGHGHYLLAHACHNQAWILMRRRRFPAAVELLARGFDDLKLAGRDPLEAGRVHALLPDLVKRLGPARLRTGDTDGAAAAATELMKLMPGEHEAIRAAGALLALCAQACAEQGDLRQAREHARQALPLLVETLQAIERDGGREEERDQLVAAIETLRGWSE